MIRSKKGVKLTDLKSQIVFALINLNEIWALYFERDLWVTSVDDSVHGKGSLHPDGFALDIRTRDLSDLDKDLAVRKIKEILGEEFDVVLESDHIHIEYDPKG